MQSDARYPVARVLTLSDGPACPTCTLLRGKVCRRKSNKDRESKMKVIGNFRVIEQSMDCGRGCRPLMAENGSSSFGISLGLSS